jgi:hypothetical protein
MVVLRSVRTIAVLHQQIGDHRLIEKAHPPDLLDSIRRRSSLRLEHSKAARAHDTEFFTMK